MKYHKNINALIYIRKDVVVNMNNIDVIVHTDKDPSDNKQRSDYIYVIYLTPNSKYDWIIISEKEFNTYVKPYINNLKLIENV